MQQRFRRLAMFLGLSSLAAGAFVVVACGTDNGTPVPTPQVEAGKDSSTGKETGSPPGEDGGVEEDGGEGGTADCSKDPVLRDFTNSFRCAFADAGGREAGSNCTKDETCCNTGDQVGGNFQPSFCAATLVATKTGGPQANAETACNGAAAANGSSFTKGQAWECADKNACGAGQLCCLVQDQERLAADPDNKLNIGNTPASDKNHPPACKVQRSYNDDGSRCRTPAVAGQCPTGEIKLCSLSDMNCGAGTVCTPFVDFQNTHRGFCKGM